MLQENHARAMCATVLHGVWLVVLLQFSQECGAENTVGTLSVSIADLRLDPSAFRCSSTGSVSYDSTISGCRILQRFCLGSGSHVGIGDSLLCSSALHSSLSTLGIIERNFTMKLGTLEQHADRKNPRKGPPAPPLAQTKPWKVYDCSNPSLCYPYLLKFPIPAALMVRAATPKLYMVLAEIDVRPPYNRRVIFHNFLTIPLPNADGLSAAQKKQNVGVKTTVQSVTASDSNTFILDLRRDLKQIAQTPEGKILVTKLFDYMLGLWDGKDKYDERDAYLPGTGKVKMNLSVAIKCSPGYGPPGDCSYQSPCSRAVLPVQQQQQSDLGGGGGGGQKKRSRRSAPGPPVQPCTDDDTLSSTDKVLIGAATGSASLVLAALGVCVRKMFGLKSSRRSLRDEDDGESMSDEQVRQPLAKEDSGSVLVIGNAMTPTDVVEFDSDFDQSDAYGTVAL
ncbi:uncharacterized protein LOC135817442 isoform X2 [Sycon ciliatum]|uniref:uncharacterized protein LOC135817442 isoform X2 n=1 Tax=Sycon ciliatum TaxID=27933 RepID=UPI0031F62AF9